MTPVSSFATRGTWRSKRRRSLACQLLLSPVAAILRKSGPAPLDKVTGVIAKLNRAAMGVKDALFIPAHPLAGARTFTFEAIFRPDGGSFEQRWFHLAQADRAAPPGHYPPMKASGPRFLFEIRVVDKSWYLDAFTAGPGYSRTLAVPEKRFPVGR